MIDVYDPNQEFAAGENNTNGVAHQDVLETSQIIVHSDGHWEFHGFSPYWHGGPGSLVVVPYGTVPVQPSLPFNVSDLVSLMFGSATATQVTEANGHRLLNSDGSVDTNPATGIADATQYATMTGSSTAGPQIFLFGHAGNYTTTVRGDGNGQYHDLLLSHDMAAALTATASPSVKDEIALPSGQDGLLFGQVGGPVATSPRPVTVQLIEPAGPGADRTATISTDVPTKGRMGAMFTKSGDVAVTAGGQATSYTMTLSWVGPHGLPQTFVAPAVKLGAGEKATLAPANWSALQSTKVMLSTVVGGKKTTRAVANKVRPPASYTVSLGVTKSGTALQLHITAHFTKVLRGSNAVMAWEVLKGRALVAKHTVSLTGTDLHSGLVTRTFKFSAKGLAHYSFRAAVEVLSPGPGGTFVSQQVTHVQQFAG